MMERTEFGVARTNCSCKVCTDNCRFMPGFLIPADLERLIPERTSIFQWAEENLLASPGAVVVRDGKVMRIPTLVPAVKEDGSCIHLTLEGQCDIHDDAPFGCALFDCGPAPAGLSEKGLATILDAIEDGSSNPYTAILIHLRYKGLEQKGPEELREKMREEAV